MNDLRSKISDHGFRRPPATGTDQVPEAPNQTIGKKLNDDELLAHFENLAPPPDQLSKKRLERLLPALAKARQNGHGLKALAEKLKEHGIEVSVVTLRAKLDAYEKRQRDPDGTGHDQGGLVGRN